MKKQLGKMVRSNRILNGVVKAQTGREHVPAIRLMNIQGTGNRFEYPASADLTEIRVEISGNNNQVLMQDGCRCNKVLFFIQGNNNRILLSKGVRFNQGGSCYIQGENCVIRIGENSGFEDVHLAATEPGSEINIGKDCMFAYEIELRTGDSHSILDSRTGKRVNYAGNIDIGDHVWIAAHCSVLKGVHILKDSIVATRSVVTKTHPQEGVLLGGCPARILKEHVTWKVELIYDAEQKQEKQKKPVR